MKNVLKIESPVERWNAVRNELEQAHRQITQYLNFNSYDDFVQVEKVIADRDRYLKAIYALDCLCGSLGSCQRNELLGELFDKECNPELEDGT